MSQPELKQLTRAEQFFDAGKLDEALELLNNLSQYEELSFQQKGYIQFLKGLILLFQNKSEEVIKLGEQIFQEGQKLNNNLLTVDGSFFILAGLCIANKFNEAFKKIEDAEALLRLITDSSKSDLIQREVRITLIKAWVNLELANTDVAEKCLDWVLQKELGNTFENVWANALMARVMFQGRQNIKIAITYTEKAISLAKEIKFNHFWIAMCQLFIGVYYAFFGEFNDSLSYHLKSLAIFKNIKNNYFTATTLNNLGGIYSSLGDFDSALESYEESLLLYELQSTGVEIPLCGLIEVALDYDDIDLAQKYYNRLESLYNHKKEGFIALLYPFEKALILKRSSRIRDKAKAEELFKQVIEAESMWFDTTQYAIIHLCDLLISEYRQTNNNEVLDELNSYIAKLLTIAEKLHSYLVFCEAFILQAKLALVNLDVKAARRFLTQAQKIAEKYGIKRLTMKISHEHDELLRKVNIWEKFKESEVSLAERWELAGLNEQLENMVRKRLIEVPELSDEVPVFLLIVSEGGVPFFSQSFIEDKSFEDHLFGGFLTAINSFINEKFSKGLDRASFGEYTVILKPIPPFLVCYFFKGQSYQAQQRIGFFIDIIQEKEEIWRVFQEFYQTNQEVQLSDAPLLKPLITEVFIDKTISLG